MGRRRRRIRRRRQSYFIPRVKDFPLMRKKHWVRPIWG
jgi:hypothetical protein